MLKTMNFENVIKFPNAALSEQKLGCISDRLKSQLMN